MLLAFTGCEAITHASSYSLYQGLCDECADATLARPPCPSPQPDAADGGGPRRVYVWRSVSLGATAPDAGWAAYDVGLDQDCSSRAPDGRPRACVALGPDPDSVVTAPPWTPLGRGIDNSLGVRVVGPLLQLTGGSFDIDAILSQRFETGQAGEVVVVDDWNGEPDDRAVTVTFAGAQGSMPSPPKWDGNDVWQTNAPLDGYAHFDGYVAGGVLVVDTRIEVEEDVRLSLTDDAGVITTFFIAGRLVARVGTLTDEHLDLITFGRWDLSDALSQVPNVTAFLLPSPDGGDPAARMFLSSSLHDLFREAADLPVASAATPGEHCAAISFALAAHAERAQVAP